MKISVVIPAHNEEKYIGRTLNSIKELDKKDWDVEVIVINGGSTDKTAEIAKKYGVKVINEPHKGIGFTRQEGLLHAKGEIVVFTDADTVVPKDWLVKHYTALTAPSVVCTYGGYRYSDGNFPLYHLFNYIQPVLVYFAYKLFNLPIASGQNIACWKKKALEIGGFDENIPVMEDTDFSLRMKKVGKVLYLPDLLIYSSGRRSREGWRFYLRMIRSYFWYFFFGKRNLERFPDFR